MNLPLPPQSFDPIQSRPTVMHIDLDALSQNFKTLKRHVKGSKVMPIVKSNAYGHGLVVCAQHLEQAGADALGVALVEEGVQLRLSGIQIPILVLGGILGNQLRLFLENNLDIVASSVFKLDAIEEAAKAMKKRARIHLEVDTGMERLGVHYYNSNQLFERAVRCEFCDIVGVSSHFADQESEDRSLTQLQLERFLASVEFFTKHSLPIPTRHIAASGGVLQFPEAHLDMVRPGVALYGITPAAHLRSVLPLRPVMSLCSRVVYFKVVKAGAGVSYGHLWTAPEDTRVVTVPIGYGDGYPRRLTNKGQVIIRGHRYPIVGAVCMDQLMVNIGPDGVAYNDDEVTLLGSQGSECITVEEIAEQTETNVREFLVSTNLRVPRKYFKEGKELIIV